MNGKQRLELTWVGKEDRPRLEPRILLEDPEQSYHAKTRVSQEDQFDNRLIFGDNLLALKALEAEFAGKVKCIYIDPPYNTGAAFDEYDDGLEHSIWLTILRDRLELLKVLLSSDGHVFLQLDDNEGHYGKVLCDEIFGRRNFVASFVWRKVDSPNDNKGAVTPDHEFVFCYAKDIGAASLNKKSADDLLDAYRGPDDSGRYFRDRLLKKNGKNSLRSDRPSMWFAIPGPDGRDVYPVHDDGREARWAAGKKSVDAMLRNGEIIWKNRGSESTPSWVPYTREYAPENPTKPFFTIWNDLPTTRQTKLHQKALFGAGSEFSTPKPEELMERILELASDEGEWVLDSFAGSGTTGAVAHKMNRRWIMIEQGEHCHTHIIPRLTKVANGEDDGGITERLDWKGGGGFRYFHLAPSMLEKDQYGNWIISKQYNPNMLAEAMCRHMGFAYDPSSAETEYWRHGYSSERDFIFVTTQSLTHDQLKRISDDVGEDRTLLICCKAFKARLDAFPNLTVKKIPMSVLAKCEWGRDDYSMGVAALPPLEGGASDQAEDQPEAEKPKRARKTRKAANEPGLFDDAGEEA